MNSTGLDFKIFSDPKSYRAFRETGCKSVQLVDIFYWRVSFLIHFKLFKPACGSHLCTKLRSQKLSSFRLFTYFLVILNGRLDTFKRAQSLSDAFLCVSFFHLLIKQWTGVFVFICSFLYHVCQYVEQ